MTIIHTVNSTVNSIDREDWEGLRQLISIEAVRWGWGVGTRLTLNNPYRLGHGTPERFIECLKTDYAWDYSLHLLASHVVDFKGDVAICRCAFQLTNIIKGARDGECYIEIGDMEHQLIRTNQGWRVNIYIVNFIANLGNRKLVEIAHQRGRQRQFNSKNSDPNL